ncbi:hypothetical protein V1278_006981 [Bradyrhizobium sp. AZCC 1577]
MDRRYNITLRESTRGVAVDRYSQRLPSVMPRESGHPLRCGLIGGRAQQSSGPAKRPPTEATPVIRLSNRFACVSLAGYGRCLWGRTINVAGRDRLNFRARQAVPLSPQASSGRLDRETIGNERAAVCCLQRHIADWAVIFALRPNLRRKLKPSESRPAVWAGYVALLHVHPYIGWSAPRRGES